MVNGEKMAHIREYEGFFSLRGAADCITMQSERKAGCPLAFRCDGLLGSKQRKLLKTDWTGDSYTWKMSNTPLSRASFSTVVN